MARSRLYHSRFEYSRNLYSRYPEGRSAGMRLLAFSGNDWRKITKRDATKENTLREFCRVSRLSLGEIVAFGDDAPDIGMLRICGLGVAMGNAIPEVKAAADVVIGTNDEDGIAQWLEMQLG